MGPGLADADAKRLTGTHATFTVEQIRDYYATRNGQTVRLDLAIEDRATGSLRAYEKTGFVAEGVLRDALYWDGEWVDAVVMSALAPEWALRSRC